MEWRRQSVDDARRRRRGERRDRRVRRSDRHLHGDVDRRRRRRGRQGQRHDRARHRHEQALMRYLFVAIIGLALGAAGAGVVLYYNPLADKAAPMPGATDRVLHYSLPDQVLQFSVGEDAKLFGQDAGDDALWEETIDRAAVLGLVLNDGSNQPVALASRLLSTSPDTNLLLRGVLVSDDWLV